MKKILALFLVLLMLLPTMLVSCETDGGDESSQSGNGDVTSAVIAETEIQDNVPELNFGGETITFFCRTEDKTMPEFYVEDYSGDTVDKALYARNKSVQERLGVEFEFIETSINFADRQTFPITLQTAIASGVNYDIVAGYSMAIANCAVMGLLADLNSTQYLDFTKPWWPSTLLEKATIKDSLYFCSGDISTWYILYTFCLLCNKDMIEKYQLDDPYALVDSGDWTFDTVFEMAYGVYEDTNNDGIKDNQDQFGYAVPHVYIDSLYFAAGLSIIDEDDSGKLKLADDYSASGEKTINFIDQLINFFHYTNDGYLVPLDNGNTVHIFQNGRTLFQNAEIAQVYTQFFSSSNINYGILPIPKYDTDQENYYTITSYPFTLYGVPTNSADTDRVSAVLECLASYSYSKVSPALFEVALKVQYSNDSKDAAMYDIIKSSVVFDLGRLYADTFNKKTYEMFRNNAVMYHNYSWATLCQQNCGAISAVINALFN